MKRVLLVSLALFAAACGDAPPPGPIPSVMIENQSQYELRELRIHHDADYREAPNRLTAAFAVDARVVYYGEGEQYVTVFREKFAGGEILAFTTAEPLVLMRDKGYSLAIFDQSFRLKETEYLEPMDVTDPILQ